MEVTITTENFESFKNGELPLVVDLWATWCGPCRALAPVISELAEEYDGKVIVVDNQRISVTMRQSVLEAKALADAGKSAEEIEEFTKTLKDINISKE